MKYYFVLLNAFEGYDSNTAFDSNYRAMGNFGIQISHFPIDDIMECDNKYFCSPRLFCSFFCDSSKSPAYKEIQFIREIRMTGNANWIYNFPNISIENWIQIGINGVPFKDDFGIYRTQLKHDVVGVYNDEFLIFSERVIKAFVLNHCSNILGLSVRLNDLEFLEGIRQKIVDNQAKYKLINQVSEF
jgi:hypothetical protein